MVDQLPFEVVRLRVPFARGPLMYLFFNMELFFFLMFSKSGILWSNDLDTLLPNFLIARLKGSRLIYDSHEYFTASVYKKSSRYWWERLERFLFPRLTNVITVNESIRKVYESQYHVPVTVLRNVPSLTLPSGKGKSVILPAGKKILIIQGMGINEHRGAEEAVGAMKYLPGEFMLYFIGGGTIIRRLKQMVQDSLLGDRVNFIDPLPYQDMMVYTRQGFLGLIFEKIDASHEHLFSLPNKFFDYIHAGLPVLSSRAVEIEKLIQKYGIGDFIESFDPKEIAGKIMAISANLSQYNNWKINTREAALDLNWETEEQKLTAFMEHLS